MTVNASSSTSSTASSTAPTHSPTLVIVDDHEMILQGTLNTIRQDYPEAEVITAQTQKQALEAIAQRQPDLLIMDLSIPKQEGTASQIENGLQLLRSLLADYPTLNIVVQSAHIRPLIRLKPSIDNHQGGFVVADKGCSLKETLKKIDWGLQGVFCTPHEMRNGLEIKRPWLEVLTLAFVEGLKDKAIAQRMNVSERTVRHYWTKVQDALDVYPEDGCNIRIQTQLRAREEGLVD